MATSFALPYPLNSLKPININPMKHFSNYIKESQFSKFPLELILGEEIPLLSNVNGTQVTFRLPSTKEIALASFGALTAVKPGEPSSLLKAGVPVFGSITPLKAITQPAKVSNKQPQSTNNVSFNGKTLIGIYNTHTGETYELTDGRARLDGKRGGVVAVAAALQSALEEKYEVKVIRSDTINDKTFSKSYSQSEKTARQILQANSSLGMLIDLHRDEAKERKVVKINGEDVANVILVVGTDATLEHPHWRENYAFAQKIVETTKSMYPGLVRGNGIMVKTGRYNQHLSPRAVLMEIGSNKNSTEEAKRAARLMADVIAKVLKDYPAGSSGTSSNDTKSSTGTDTPTEVTPIIGSIR